MTMTKRMVTILKTLLKTFRIKMIMITKTIKQITMPKKTLTLDKRRMTEKMIRG